MDGAGKQIEQAEKLKAEIKLGTSGRRERQRLQDQLQQADPQAGFIVTSQLDYGGDPGTSAAARKTRKQTPPEYDTSTSPESGQQLHDRDATFLETTFDLRPPRQTHSEWPMSDPGGGNPDNLSETTPPVLGDEWELDLIMMYLDHVFPFFFPFYHPHLVNGGRAWVMSFLKNSSATYNSVISVTSYFYTVRVSGVYPGQVKDCTGIVWESVLKHVDHSSRKVHANLDGINLAGRQAGVFARARVLGSLVQILTFKLFLGRPAWDVHLTPAIKLLEDLLEESPSPENSLLRILDELDGNDGPVIRPDGRVYNADQVFFRFYTASVVYLDIVLSICLDRPPRLRKYHAHVLCDDKPGYEALIDMSTFFGCKNWTLLAVAEIAALSAWKKEQKRAGSLSVPDLVQRADSIYQSLAQGLTRLDEEPQPSGIEAFDRIRSFYDHFRSNEADLTILPTRVWAYAARIYLAVVVSGWQPSNAQIRSDVAQITALLRESTSVAQLHAMSWPICIAGCLAETDEQRQNIRSTISSMGDTMKLHVLREAVNIMEAVWSSQNVGSESWDLAACLRILGRPALLM